MSEGIMRDTGVRETWEKVTAFRVMAAACRDGAVEGETLRRARRLPVSARFRNPPARFPMSSGTTTRQGMSDDAADRCSSSQDLRAGFAGSITSRA